METELDLRSVGTLTVEDAKKITSLEPIVRKEYNQFIGLLVKENGVTGLDWLLRITCRNTHISLIHDRLSRLALLESRLEEGKVFDSVLIDSQVMLSATAQLLERHGVAAEIKVSGRSRRKRQLRRRRGELSHRLASNG